MSFDFPVTLEHIFNPVFSVKAASQLGEEQPAVQKAFSAIIPVVLTGLLHRASSPGDAGMLTAITRDASTMNTSQLANGLSASLMTKGAGMLQTLFGSRLKDVIAAISRYAGIQPASATSLLQVTAPVALGVAGQQTGGPQLTATSLLAFLNSQQETILAAVPSGLGLSTILGINNLGDISRKLAHAFNNITGRTPEDAADASVSRWFWVMVALAMVFLLLWYLLKGCGGRPAQIPADSVKVTDVVDSVTGTPIRETAKVRLPDGKILDAYKGGMEDRLVAFLQDPNTTGGKDTWFDFDDISFKTGSAELTEESLIQVQNIVAILNAYPKTKVKIGGYTDRVGDSVANIKLSRERADAVYMALQAGHVRPVQLLGAEGYGSRFAKADADAPNEERKLDRRISVEVREK